LNIQVLADNRGSPEEGDLLCLPTAEDLNKFLSEDYSTEGKFFPVEERLKLVSLKAEESCREPIGCVEFGGYSSETGCGKGMGWIVRDKYSQLLRLNGQVNSDTKKVLGLMRSKKSSAFRFVTFIPY